MIVNTKLGLYEYISAVNEIASEFFDENGEYRPHYGMLNAMRVFYNLCVKVSKFDGTIPHDFDDLTLIEPLVNDDEFLDEFNVALNVDRVELAFGNAFADAREIVNTKRDSVNYLIDGIRTTFLKLVNEINAVDVNKLVDAVNNADVDTLIDAYKDSEHMTAPVEGEANENGN